MIHVKRGNVIVLGCGSTGGAGTKSFGLSGMTTLLFLAILIIQVYQVVRMDIQLNTNNNNNIPQGRSMHQFVRGGRDTSTTPQKTRGTADDTRSSTSSIINTDKQEESFSACLMIMDDNAHLIEWLAYHYHTLPLRRLIVAVDPRSQTSPSSILQRWRDSRGTIQMDITEWSDVDFMPPTLMDAHRQNQQHSHIVNIPVDTSTSDAAAAAAVAAKNADESLTKLFRRRQEEFYARCMARLKYEGRTWVALVDTDEYITPNTHSQTHYAYLKEQKESSETSNQRVTVLDLLNNAKERSDVEDDNEAARQEAKLARQLQASPCFPMARLTFGVKESDEEDLYQTQTTTANSIPWGFDPHDFQTLRWRWHAGRSKKSVNKISKSLMDVSRVDSSFFVPTSQVMVHLPIQEYCHGEDDLWILNSQSLLVVHHYGGTWEQWSHRDDTRGKRTREAYEQMQYGKQADNSIRPWLAAFVRQVGWWTARRLLQNVGQI
jgi:hypothetical protein